LFGGVDDLGVGMTSAEQGDGGSFAISEIAVLVGGQIRFFGNVSS